YAERARVHGPSGGYEQASRSSAALARLRDVAARVVPDTPEYRPTRRRRVWLMTMYVLRRWAIEDRAAGMSGLLTMHTLLSTVPIIGVGLLVVALMDPAAGERLLGTLFRSLVPESDRAADLAQSALSLAQNVTLARLGTWGFLGTLVVAFVLFSTLERTFNRIWRVAKRRSVLVQFTMFYTLATLGPLVMLFSLATPLLAGMTVLLASPIILSLFALVLLNRFLPFTQVRWHAALVGGTISAILLEGAKFGFGFYATRFALRTYEGMYGSLAMLPIVIVWSYVSWMVILLGAQITYAVHNHRAIALQGFLNRYVLERASYLRPTGRTAARIMLAICDHFSQRQVGISIESIGERFRLALDHVGDVVDALERAGWVLETAEPRQLVIPARPPDQIRVIDVLTLFDRDQTVGVRDDRLGALLRELDDARATIMAEATFGDLVRVVRARPDDEVGAAEPDPQRAG
ncbi:MAG: YihY family inner membrane protein, partial [Nannocystaceae bacterium]|nr:YihY family inner membrane protein [Nannocystaceae bacterium]